LKELEQISSSVPTFPAFGSGTVQTSSAADKAGIHKYYRSSANFDEVKNFYFTQLSQRGWSLFDSDAKGEITFRKGEFLIGIYYTGNNSKSSNWNYSVSFVWRDYLQSSLLITPHRTNHWARARNSLPIKNVACKT
jgi:hypothetical protein